MQKPNIEMEKSKQLAQLIGPTLSVMTLSEAINLHIWANITPPVVFLNGLLLFVAGISIVRVHNYWKRDWQMGVTLVGWFCIVLGLFRIFLPEAKQAEGNIFSYSLLFILFAIGLSLTFKGYYKEKKLNS